MPARKRRRAGACSRRRADMETLFTILEVVFVGFFIFVLIMAIRERIRGRR